MVHMNQEIAKIKNEHDAFHLVTLESFHDSEPLACGLLKSAKIITTVL